KRFAAWRRSQDQDFQTLHSFTASWSMPESVALQIYDLKEQGLAAANAIRNDPNVIYEEGRTARREIRARVEQRISELMGQEIGTRYLETGGGSWVNGIASKPR